jgi:hypothetical protein
VTAEAAEEGVAIMFAASASAGPFGASREPAPRGRPGELARLAAALGTSREDLRGADPATAPPGPDAADRRGAAVDLTPEECLGRLGRHGSGRVVFDAGDGLTVRPVDYRMADGAVLFRTQETGTLTEAVGRRVVLEVDRFDDVLALGWSVLVTGFAEADQRDADQPGTGDEEPRPWSAGPRDLLVRIQPIRVTGRELRFRTPVPAGNEQ